VAPAKKIYLLETLYKETLKKYFDFEILDLDPAWKGRPVSSQAFQK
jgi:hypothetical protein